MRIFDEEEENLFVTSFGEETFAGSVDEEEFSRVKMLDGLFVEKGEV